MKALRKSEPELALDLAAQFTSTAAILDYLQERAQFYIDNHALERRRYRKGSVHTRRWRADVLYRFGGFIGLEGCWLINREYKPVGRPYSDPWAQYQDYPYHRVEKPAALDFAEIDVLGRRELGAYLFKDGCPPWNTLQDARAYARRLQIVVDALRKGVR